MGTGGRWGAGVGPGGTLIDSEGQWGLAAKEFTSFSGSQSIFLCQPLWVDRFRGYHQG